MRASWVDIHPNATWNKNGQTAIERNSILTLPHGLFVAEDQTVYVVDQNNNRIVAWKDGDTRWQVVAGGNGEGDDDNQLDRPTDVIVDKKTDSLLICDYWNRRVVRWPRRYGTRGETILSGISCYGLTMDEEGSLYVSDVVEHEVRRYRRGDSLGVVVAGGNEDGRDLNQLSGPRYLFVDREHSVFVSDYNNNRVMKWAVGANEGIVVAGGRGEGKSLSQLSNPNGVLVDQLGTVYVADSENNRVVRWPQGAQQGTVVVGGNGQGAKSNQLSVPKGLSFDRFGNLYVTEFGINRMVKYTLEMSSN
ncbi:unnamed protein product [Adineta steineri]|uniref:Uncharacterized protein n=1 Tax=Adineta steineri TaxID=433720 RepID=A0A816BB63_9BILA|nr:unnamed protein product [Adineta steineri]CAF1608567.1 unnamed protein product [Adineta steineri]